MPNSFVLKYHIVRFARPTLLHYVGKISEKNSWPPPLTKSWIRYCFLSTFPRAIAVNRLLLPLIVQDTFWTLMESVDTDQKMLVEM